MPRIKLRFLCLAFVALGCSSGMETNSTENLDGKSALVHLKQTESATKASLKPNAAKNALKNPPKPALPNLVKNESFERWNDDVPEVWFPEGPARIQKGAAAKTGKASIQILPSDTDKTQAVRHFLRNAILPGTSIVADGWVQAPIAHMAGIRIGYTAGGALTYAVAGNKGGEDFSFVSVKVDLPANFEEGSLFVDLIRRPDMQGDVYFDQVSVVNLGPAPSSTAENKGTKPPSNGTAFPPGITSPAPADTPLPAE